MAKLFRFAELEARIRLRLRAGVDQAEPTVLAQGRIRLDLRTRQATIDAVTVELSAREFTLAELFLRNPVRCCPASSCCPTYGGTTSSLAPNVVDVYVGYLRKKPGADSIQTVRGYRLRVKE